MSDHDADVTGWHVLRFFNDYGAGHPLWQADGLASLEELRLSPELCGRLEDWSTYWDDQMDWEHGWRPGPRDDWFDREGEALPRAVAEELGRDFAIHAGHRIVRSDSPPTNPAAAAALHALGIEEEALMQELREARAAGEIVEARAARASLDEPANSVDDD